MKKHLQKFMAALALLLFMVPAMVTWGQTTEGDTHEFSQSLQQLLNNNASIPSINIEAQSYPVKKVTISYRYNKTITEAVTMAVSVNGVSWGTAYSTGTGSNYTTVDFQGTSVTGPIAISFTNNTGNGTGHGTFYVDKVILTEGSSGSTPTTYTVTLADDNTSLSGSSVTLPSRNAVGDYTFAGWSGTNVPTETTTAPTTIIPAGSYTPTNDITLYPVYTRTEGDGDLTTSNTLTNISNENNWTTSAGNDVTCYTSFNLNNHITVSTTGSPNCGSFWGNDWRLYQNKSGNVIISTNTGTLKSVKFTYTITNSGTLNYNSSAITSGTTVNVSGTSVEFTVGNSGTATNGQVRITAIDVTYSNSTIYYWSSPVPSTDPSIAASDVNIAYDATSGSIAYTINNVPDPAGTMTANTTANWLTLGTVTSEAVLFTCTANDNVVSRTATVTLTYTYNNNTTTKDIVVTQGFDETLGTANNPYTVAQARAFIDGLNGSTSTEKYVSGIISQIDSYDSNHSSITYWISDDGTTTNQLEVYSGKGINGANFSSIDDVELTAEVVVKGNLKKYNTTYEFNYNNELVEYNGPLHDVEAPTFSPVAGTYTEAQTVTISCATYGATIYYTTDGSEPTDASTLYTTALNISATTTVKAIAYVGDVASTVASATYHINSQTNPYTVAQAIQYTPATGESSEVYVHGVVSEIVTAYSSEYGNISYNISADGETTGDQLEAYRGKGLNNNDFTSDQDILPGDVVTIYGKLKKHNDTYELAQGNYLVSFERPVVPVINADDVQLAYDATSGVIYYTIDNSVQGTNLTATSTADWISNIVVGSENITFTTTTNDGEDNRTATITLTYGSVTKNVTVTQEVYTAPVTTGTIVFGNNGTKIDAASKTGNDNLGNTWTITTVGTTSFTQNTDYSQVGKAAEPATSITFTTTLPAAATVTSFEAKFGGYSNTAGDITLSVGNTIVGTGFLNGTSDVTVESTTSATGTVLSVVVSNIDKGVKCYYISYTLSTSTEPFISVTPNEAEVVYNGGIPEFVITYANMAITSASSLDVQFYEADGITTVTKPSWIGDVEFSAGTTGESYDLLVEVNANTGAERTAYFKVYAMDDETNLVYSNLVTITQAEAPQLYTLTVSNLSHVNLFVFGGDESETIIETESGQTTAQVYNGTEVMVSIDIEEGYVFQSLTITDANGDPVETEVLILHEYYAFTMPTSNVTITATAVEAPAADDYELFNGTIVEGDYLIVYENAAMNTTATSNRLQYDEVTPNNNVITTANTAIVWHIAPSGNYWTIYNAEANAYAAATGSKNQAQMLGDGTDDKALWTVTGIETYDFENKARAAASSDPNNKWLRKNTNYGFACYASGTGGALSLYKKVENIPVEPSIAVTPEEVSVDAGAHEGTLDINYTNLTISDMTDFDIQYYDANGDEAEAPDWIEVLVAEQDPTIGEGYVVSYYMLENDGAERTAYFKIYAMDDETNLVYSNLVTVTQAGVPHTAYFFEGTGDCDVVSLTGSSINLPEATASQGWSFAGWAEAPVNETETAPSTVSSPYAPADDIFLYAVYQNNGTYNSFPTITTTQLDVTEGFETYAANVTPDANGRTFVKPTGWTVVTQYDPVANSKRGRPQVFKNASVANNSMYSLLMDTLSLLAMPKLAEEIVVSNIQMEFYLRQSADCHALEVGVMSDLMDMSSFEHIAYINNVGLAVNHRMVDFSSYNDELGGRYIVFRNYYTNTSSGRKSFNYLDDITLMERVESNCGITSLPASWNFESEGDNNGDVLECWTLVNRDKYRESQYDPQVNNQPYYANNGESSLKLDGEGLYAMPEFKVEGKTLLDVQMEFNVRQSSANCKLRVGVMKDVNDPSTFIQLGESISNNGASGYRRYVIDLSEYEEELTNAQGEVEYKYIAFRNYYEGNWGRSPHFIDDIIISELDYSCGISELPSVWGFETVESDESEDATSDILSCWTLSSRDKYRESQYDPQVNNQPYYANNGESSLKLDGEGLYAMPEFKVEGKTLLDVQMEFNVRQSSANCKLRVGVMKDVNDPSTFIQLGESISNNGASGYRRYVIDLSEYEEELTNAQGEVEYKYIAFRNYYEGNWGRSPHFIDDITLSLISNENTGDETEMAQNQSANTEDTEFDNNNANSEEPFNAPNAISNFSATQLSLYPNPTSGKVTLVADEVTMVEVYSQIGSKVATFTMNNERVIDLANLPKGVYILRVTMPQGIAIRKVVKN